MEIRILTAEDTALYWSMRLEGLETEPFAFGRSVEEHRTTTFEQTAERLSQDPEQDFTLGAFDNGLLVGIATFVREAGLKERHKGHIYGVYVTASHRRRGIARQLIRELLHRAGQDTSLEQILLAVSTRQEAASALYRTLGFEHYGTEPRALKIGTDYVDEAHLVLTLR
jgi:ribosomal protein S18 acetylase RimI-like enzyme